MTSILTDLPHNTRMIHGAVTLCAFQLCARDSLIDRLDKAIAQGATLDPDCEEERSLALDIRELRKLALLLEQRRAQLIDNAMPKFLLIESSRKAHAR